MPRFQKSDRVRTVRDWRAARRARMRVATESISLSFTPAEKRRLGVVVGGSVGNAVVRNRVKRVIREYFRLKRSEFPPGDCVVIARPKAGSLANGEIRSELGVVLEKIGRRL